MPSSATVEEGRRKRVQVFGNVCVLWLPFVVVVAVRGQAALGLAKWCKRNMVWYRMIRYAWRAGARVRVGAPGPKIFGRPARSVVVSNLSRPLEDAGCRQTQDVGKTEQDGACDCSSVGNQAER